MKTILVATDFSPAALNAANYAVDMALRINAAIHLIHVFEVPISYSEVPVVVNLEEMMQSAEKEINALKAQLNRKTMGKIIVATEVKMGEFFLELKTACERLHPYAVLMGSQGTTAAERLFFGGHAVYAMTHLMWPLITVPAGAAFSSIKRIGLACDLDNVLDTTPVNEIKKLINDFNAELHILNTGRKEEFIPEVVVESGSLRRLLEPVKPEYHFISNKNATEGIMDFVEKNQIDLLIVLPKRHGLMDKLIHKSHTKRFVLNSDVPVMALHK